MGADGHIIIWRDDVVRAQFPDCDDLFRCLPTHYAHELDGVKYHHLYHGDNMYFHWADESDWYLAKDKEMLRPRLKAFVEWLYANGTEWEVWT